MVRIRSVNVGVPREVEGLLEDKIHIGDRFRSGSAEFVVTQARASALPALPEEWRQHFRERLAGI